MRFRRLAIENQRAPWRDALHTTAESIRQKRGLRLDELDHAFVVARREASIMRMFPRGSVGMVPVGRDELVSMSVSLSFSSVEKAQHPATAVARATNVARAVDSLRLS